MAKERVWAIIKCADGTIKRQLIGFKGAEKIEKKMTDDFRKKIWLNKTHCKYLDDKSKSELS